MQNSKNTQSLAFIADCHLGKLTKYLRFMGYDTLYFPQIDDNDLIELANRDQRIILTRDRELSEREKAPCMLLESVKTGEQLQEIIRMYDLKTHDCCFRRCIICNEPLVQVDKEDIIEKLPEKVVKHFSHFERCNQCGRVYWHGDHYKRMKATIEKISGSV
jgi:uncharacterized protein with PIN domain